MRTVALVPIFLAFVLTLQLPVDAQDPASSWLVYAETQCPEGQTVTRFEGKWKVGPTPMPSFTYYTPWIGIETSDNMNLLQPVNPWDGRHWTAYAEYFQWSPVNNINSEIYHVPADSVLVGTVTATADYKYEVRIKDLASGIESSQLRKVQKDNAGNYKNYTRFYVVYEHHASSCNLYPSSQEQIFYDLTVECDGNVVSNPAWSARSKQPICDFQSSILNSSAVKITWSTTSSKVLH